MNPICQFRPLAAAINAAMAHRGDRWCRRPVATLALIAAFGCLSHVALATTYVVTTTGDPGPGGSLSLRQAITLAGTSSDSTVTFGASLIGSTITLAEGEISFGQAMTIAGPGADRLTLSGADASRIFYLSGADSFHVPITIAGLTLTHGHASGGGGALFARYVNLTLQDSVIDASTATFGGGLAIEGGSATISGSRIRGNYATDTGGGIDAFNAQDVSVTSSTISENGAGDYGGGICASDSVSMSLSYSLINGNSLGHPEGQPQGGGGISLKNISASVLNSTISGNFAPDGGGGGIGIRDAATGNGANFSYVTIVGNATQTDSGNGMYVAPGGAPFLQDCIIANNSSQANSDDLAGKFFVESSLIKNQGSATVVAVAGANLIGVDPQLGPLRDNGGPTLTMLPLASSPVIDAADLLSPVPYRDQRNLPRGVTNLPDIGAVERQFPEDLIFRSGFDPP